MRNYQLIILFFLLFHASFMQAQVLYNTGDMYVGGMATENGEPALYIQGDIKTGKSSKIDHQGKTVLTGNFINDVTGGNVFSSWGGIFEFKGNASQQITGTADRSSHYIKFPDQVIINMASSVDYKQSTVVIDTCMGISVKNLKFKNGRMVVDSKAVPNNSMRTQVAHLWVEEGGIITYNHTETASSANGFVQVNLDLGNNHLRGGLIGFTSPYKALYADYFLYNFLSMPGTSRLFNGDRNDLWIRNPLTKLTPGTGYILGQALVSHDTYPSYYKPDPQWAGALFADVVKEKYFFGRMLAPASFTQFNKNSDRYTGEELNTSDVTVPITEGYNYLGNPFTVPLDLASYINGSGLSDFGVSSGEVENVVYLLKEGAYGTYSPQNPFSFTATFVTMAEAGGTYEGGNSSLIAPMQMFVVKKKTDTPNSFKIPVSKRSRGETSLLRSAPQEAVDELLIETRDNITGGYDRLCVVFRNDATSNGSHRYDAEKLFNKTGGVNQIYTRSSNNKELVTNVVKPDTKKLTMYFTPSNQRQEVTLKAKRLNSLRSITSVILEDHKTGRLMDLMKTSYTFISSSSDKPDRFTLHFNSGLVGIDDIRAAAPLSATYSFGQVTVQGLTEKALNKDVMIYTMQGQLVHRQTVTAIEPLLMAKFLDRGVYVINVTEEPQTIKLWVK